MIAIACVLMYALMFSATSAFADEPTPPTTTSSEETVELPADESQSEPAAEIEEDDEIVEEQDEEQADAPDVETGLLAEPQDETVTQTEESDAEEPLPAEEEGTTSEQEIETEEPPDADSETAEEPAPVETSVVVLINEQVEPLATQEAAEALALGDPVWCPAGANPGDPGCSDPASGVNYDPTSLDSLLSYLRANQPASDGTIWIEDTYSSSADTGVASFTLNGNTLTTWAQHALTFQGGWNNGTGTVSGVSYLAAPIRVLNWSNTVSVNDISIDLGNPTTTTLDGLTVTTTGDIHLDNVTGQNSSRNGATLNNTSGTGNINVTASSFNGNSSGNGLVANSIGTITLHNVTASNNGSNGASLNDSNVTGAIALSGTNVFNGNTLSGLRAVSNNDITISGNLTADGNSQYGAFLRNNLVGSTGNVSLSGMNNFNSNTADGLRIISNGNVMLSGTNVFDGNTTSGLRVVTTGNISGSGSLTAGSNGQYGVLLRNDSKTGSVSLAGTLVANSNMLEGLRVFSNGNINIAADLTASNNSRYGVYVDNTTSTTTGVGNVTFSGTNTFNGNDRNGLHVLSNGAVSLANLTADNNGTGGVFRAGYGVYVDNTTGSAGVNIGGSNSFNGNYSTGLVVLTNGTIVANNLSASNNSQTGNSRSDYGYGAYLDSSASVKLTGASLFNSNYASGLLVNSKQDVTLNSITAGSSAATGNGAHGILVISGSTVSLTGSNNLIGNLLDGAHITAVGSSTIYNPNAALNGGNGIYMETTQGNTSLRCGYSGNNGAYGVYAVGNIVLSLYGMDLNGNGLGDVYTDGGLVNSYPYGCDDTLRKHALGGGSLGINEVFVSAVRGQVALDCRLYAGTRLILPNGDSALIPCPSGEFASLRGLTEADLPGALPEGWAYGSGFALGLDQAQGSRADLSFVVPDGMSADTLAILFWDGSQWVAVAGANQKGERFEAQVDYPGLFILVSK